MRLCVLCYMWVCMLKLFVMFLMSVRLLFVEKFLFLLWIIVMCVLGL